MFNSINKSKRGFTLVEMIVSLGIFAVVALVAVGAFMKIMDANRKALGLKTAINNLNFALESMTREIRMGSKYSYSSGDDWTITFQSSKRNLSDNCNRYFSYQYVSNEHMIYKAEEPETDNTCIQDRDPEYYPLVSDNIIIDKTNIVYVSGDSVQPRFTIYLNGYTENGKMKEKTEFSLQTTISQRLPYQ